VKPEGNLRIYGIRNDCTARLYSYHPILIFTRLSFNPTLLKATSPSYLPGKFFHHRLSFSHLIHTSLNDVFSHLPRRNPSFKHSIDLIERPSLQLRTVEITTNARHQSQSTKYKPHLPLEIPFVGINHIGNREIHDNSEDCLSSSRQTNSLCTQGWRGCFSEDDECHFKDFRVSKY